GELVAPLHGARLYVSFFDWITADWLRWVVHVVCLLVFFCLLIGYRSRTAALLSLVAALGYVERVTPGAFFGLDKTNLLLVMYLAIAPCGARYSVDRLLRLRRGDDTDPPATTSANLA